MQTYAHFYGKRDAPQRCFALYPLSLSNYYTNKWNKSRHELHALANLQMLFNFALAAEKNKISIL